MGEFVLKVVQSPGGWAVETANWASALMSRDNAVNLAEGMAAAMRWTGEAVRVVVEDMPVEGGLRRPT